MGDIDKHLPEQTETVSRIYEHYKKVGDSQSLRKHLGASEIGGPCERYLWYSFRHGCKAEFPGRMYRLFARGDVEEPRMAADLRAIGCTVHTVDDYFSAKEKPKQFRFSALGGHFGGSMDGCALGVPEAPKTWHVLEFKTHNAKSFTKLIKQEVEKAHPKHYAQMMTYMHLSGMKRALYVAVNKDTEELYTERIRYDKALAEAMMDRAERIIFSTTPPERIANRQDYYLCKWCDAQKLCWGTEPPDPALPVSVLSCRQCCHATPSSEGDTGVWTCEKLQKSLLCADKVTKCEHHLILPGFLASHEATNHGHDGNGNDYICFLHSEWGKWTHGRGKGMYSSEELRQFPIPILSNDTVREAKLLFGGKLDMSLKDLLDSYPEGTCEIVWSGPLDYEAISKAWLEIYGGYLIKLKRLATSNQDTHSVAEYEGGRAIVAFHNRNAAQIREKKAPEEA